MPIVRSFLKTRYYDELSELDAQEHFPIIIDSTILDDSDKEDKTLKLNENEKKVPSKHFWRLWLKRINFFKFT